ncbi:hypothetical protein A3A79_04085 [Candidatus Gottesmanbacteria bacterium RIFCSPLOWO2_01_FULL_43_11b]|uniref:Uncharacterized protein n=1 Tax=Candidatus Gottesmanbacteria bacterium RIFCSPLOWO2_01_FULL_43_11b TaxID=1798392 RepID=A0A1F6AI91_9BACT|nr:MAG: hypothetical protein A3A79_04085 [Candidatus Gottesmanbacteria bacterium RIFCSPLOWO2_01_FULL_43_11b]
MASLTETAYLTRRAINWAILTVIAYVILRFLWGIFLSLWLTVFPPKPPPPNHAFGKLPTLAFPTPSASPSGQLVFRLETIEGSVPRASESAAVYFMPKSPPNFLGIPKTQEFAKRLGLDPTPIAESKNIYRFQDPDTPLRRLRYDIVSNNFILRYEFGLDTELFPSQNLPLPDAAIAEARSMLQTHDLYQEDYVGGEVNTAFLKLIGNQLVTTSAASGADAIRVDFFRKLIGQMRVLSPTPDQAPISFILSGSRDNKKRILQLAYTYWPVDYKTFATYSLRTSLAAWQDLQSGNGYIARYPTGTTVVVRNIYLAYYDSLEAQTYLQPIFVFEGDGGFLGYVPAVNSDWIE